MICSKCLKFSAIVTLYLIWILSGILCNPNSFVAATIKPRSTLTRTLNQFLTLTSPIPGLEKSGLSFSNQTSTSYNRSSSNQRSSSSNQIVTTYRNHNQSSSNQSPSFKVQNGTSRYNNPSFAASSIHNGSSSYQKEASNSTKVNHTMVVTPTGSERYGRDASNYDGIDLTQYEGIPVRKHENFDKTIHDGIDRNKYDVIDLTNFGVVDRNKYHMDLPKYVSTEETKYHQLQKILKQGVVNEEYDGIDLTKRRRPPYKMDKDVEKEDDGTDDGMEFAVTQLIKYGITKPNRNDVIHGAKYQGIGLTDEEQGTAQDIGLTDEYLDEGEGTSMESYDVVYYEDVYEDGGEEMGYQDEDKSDRNYAYETPSVFKIAPKKKLSSKRKMPPKRKLPPKRKVVVKRKPPKNNVRRKWKKPKPVIRRKVHKKNKYKQETTTEDYDQETTTTITTTTTVTTTSGYKGAVIALQPAYQIAKNKYHLGIASTFFPFLTGESVRGPIYAEIPLFSDEDDSSSCSYYGGGFSHWFGHIFRRKLRVVRCKK